MKVSHSYAPRWALPVHAFVPSESGLTSAASLWRRNSLRGIQQLWFCCFRPWGMLHLFGGWSCFLFPSYPCTAQCFTPGKKIHNKDPTIASWLTSWKMSSLSRYCCASWELLMISYRLRGWRSVCWRLWCLQGRVWSPSCVVRLSADVSWSHKPQNWLLGWGQGPPAWVETQAVGLLLGWLIHLPHWFCASVTLWVTSGLYWSRENCNITSGSILLHWKTLKADCFIKAVTVL